MLAAIGLMAFVALTPTHASTALSPQTDLSVVLSGPTKANVQLLVNYTIEARNSGPDVAERVVVSATVPDEAGIWNIFGGLQPGYSCTDHPADESGTVSCTIDQIGSGESFNLQLSIHLIGHGGPGRGQAVLTSTTTTATISSAATDPQPANNSVTITTLGHDPWAPVSEFCELFLWSAPGDYVGGGQTAYFSNIGGDAFIFYVSVADTVGVRFYKQPQTAFWSLHFSSAKMHMPLAPAVYANAQRWPFEEEGHPGLDVGGSSSDGTAGRGCNKSFGWFKVLAYDIDSEFSPPLLLRFAAEFEQHCESESAPPLRGLLQYNFDVPRRRAVRK